MKNKFVILILTFISLNKVFADISISASVDKNIVSLDGQITLQVVVSGDATNIPQPQIPILSDFQIYSSGRSQSISIINGQVNSSVSFNYILSPRKVGEFEIPPIKVEYKGKIYQTEPIKIKVEKSQSVPQNQQSQKQIPLQENIYKGQKRDIFVETFVDKKNVYVNEQITLTFRFYTRINLLSQPQYSPPDTTGFITEDLPPQKSYYTIIDGHRYYVSEIKTALFPVSSGKFTIGPAMVKCMVEDFDIDDFFSDSFFKKFFSQGKEIVLKSNPIEINVLSLPQPQPKMFSGNVGNYNIDVSIDKNEIQQNETTFLNIKIYGTGNIKSIVLQKSLIEEILGNNFLVYEPISSFDIKKENYLVKGSKTFKIPVSAVISGKLQVPEIKFIFFNPQSKKYETVNSKPLEINVLPSSNVKSVIKPQSQTERITKKIELEDIRYLKTSFNTKRFYFNQNIYLYIQILPLFLWLCFSGYKSYKSSVFKDIKKYRFTKALKNAKKEIKKIKQDENFIEKLYNIVAVYLSDKMYISKEAVCVDEIKRFFEGKIEEQIYKELISLWEELNFYRFAPTKIKDKDFNQWVEKTINILQKLDYEIQKI